MTYGRKALWDRYWDKSDNIIFWLRIVHLEFALLTKTYIVLAIFENAEKGEDKALLLGAM